MKEDRQPTILGMNEELFMFASFAFVSGLYLFDAYKHFMNESWVMLFVCGFGACFFGILSINMVRSYIKSKRRCDVAIENMSKDISYAFNDYVVKYSTDPEAIDIMSVDVYDIPDEHKQCAKEHLWRIIDRYQKSIKRLQFVPHIVCHSETKDNHPEYLRHGHF